MPRCEEFQFLEVLHAPKVTLPKHMRNNRDRGSSGFRVFLNEQSPTFSSDGQNAEKRRICHTGKNRFLAFHITTNIQRCRLKDTDGSKCWGVPSARPVYARFSRNAQERHDFVGMGKLDGVTQNLLVCDQSQ